MSVKIPPPVKESRSGENMAARYYEKDDICVCIFSMAAALYDCLFVKESYKAAARINFCSGAKTLRNNARSDESALPRGGVSLAKAPLHFRPVLVSGIFCIFLIW